MYPRIMPSLRDGAPRARAHRINVAACVLPFALAACGGERPGASIVPAPRDALSTPPSAKANDLAISSASLVAAQEAKLLPADGMTNDAFGTWVSVSGDTMIGGAPGDADNGFFAGGAYVYVRTNGAWSLEQHLLASDGAIANHFGFTVDLEGDTAVVGAPLDDDNGSQSGSVYIFNRSGGVWTEAQTIVPADGAAGDWFGYPVVLEGNTLLIGAFHDDPHGYEAGSAYVYILSGGAWTFQQKLSAPDCTLQCAFGASLALLGDTALVGAAGDDVTSENSGSAYVFTRAGGVWTPEQKLVPSDPGMFDNFGVSVALSLDTAVIGSNQDDDKGTNAGAAYVFTRAGASWTQAQKLFAGDASELNYFGQGMSMSGDTLAIGASSNPTAAPSGGAGYIFTRAGGLFTEDTEFFAADAASGDNFGGQLAIDIDTVVVGVSNRSENGQNSGAVYVMTLKEPGPNGQPCAVDDACASGACVDGVCCDTPCGGGVDDCQRCDFPAATGVCSPAAAGTPCRAAAGVCDVPESCDGSALDCPNDTFTAGGTECRAVLGDCDVAEVCSGVAPDCPADALVPAGVLCRDAIELCDVAELCDGASPTCPADALQVTGVVCFTSIGPCDPEEVCTGATLICPADAYAPDGSACPGGSCLSGQCIPGSGGAGGGGGAGSGSGGDAGSGGDTNVGGGGGGVGGDSGDGGDGGDGGSARGPRDDGGCGCELAGANEQDAGLAGAIAVAAAACCRRRRPRR